MALNHLGFIYIKSYMIEAELKKKTLIEILPEYMKTQIPIYVYYRQQPYIDQKIKAFIEFFVNSS
jgi:DNA-binding transcriptional LysR family regulator